MCSWASHGGEAKLVAYVAGKVRGPAGARVRAHLEDCERCSEFVSRQQSIWHLMDEWQPEFAPSPNFNHEFAVRLANLPPEPWLVKTARFVTARFLKPAVTVTAATALLAISLYVRDPFSGNLARPTIPAPAGRVISPVEAEQMDRAFDDLQLLHQLDPSGESSKDATRSM